MKAKLIGAIILIAVIIGAAGYYFYGKAVDVTVINGYLGGEKIGVMEDEEIAGILAKKYHIAFDYSRAGSLDKHCKLYKCNYIVFVKDYFLIKLPRSFFADKYAEKPVPISLQSIFHSFGDIRFLPAEIYAKGYLTNLAHCGNIPRGKRLCLLSRTNPQIIRFCAGLYRFCNQIPDGMRHIFKIKISLFKLIPF